MTELERVTRGVWRPPADVADLIGRTASMMSALPPRAVVSGMTAARLHDLWLPPPTLQPMSTLTPAPIPTPGQVEVTLPGEGRAPRDTAGSARPELRVRRRTVLADEITTTAGLPTTSLARTWLDLAEVMSAPDLIAAGDSVLRRGVGIEELELLVKRARGRRGLANARRCLPLLDGRARSNPESHLRSAITLAGLPTPEVNRAVYDDHGGWLAEPDLHYKHARLALEYYGEDHAELTRMRRDITRALDMDDRRWTVHIFGPTQVFRRRDQIVALVARELHVAVPQPGTRPGAVGRSDRRLAS